MVIFFITLKLVRLISSQYGIGRLCLPKVHSRIRYPHTWDTPSPPRFVDPLGTHKTFAEFDWTFHTVEMDKITGLTFLHYGGDMAAIHAHTRDEPSASATVERLLPWIKRPTVWEYHPAAAVRECLNNPPPPLRSSYRRVSLSAPSPTIYRLTGSCVAS